MVKPFAIEIEEAYNKQAKYYILMICMLAYSRT